MYVLAQECAPTVSNVLMQSLVRKESAFKPYAIGMDSKQGTVKQPETLEEAIATVKQLKKEGRTFSIGLAQIHIANVEKYNLSLEQAFDPCTNLHTGELILNAFYKQSINYGYKDTSALWAMLRGYNCGNINCAVSNQYAHDILSYANMLGDAQVNVAMNYEIKNIKVEDAPIKEEEKDIFSNNPDSQKDIFSNNL